MFRVVIPPIIGRIDRRALVLALAALLLYAPGSWWGAPTATAEDRVRAWGVDDSAPLLPLAEVHNILDPKPDRNLGYPLLHAFLATAAYTPYLGWLYATGGLEGLSGEYPFGLRDPVRALRTFTYINHGLTVLLGIVAVLAGYSAAATLWSPATGALAAAFAMTLYPMFYYARTGNVDVPMLAFLMLALAALARALVHGMSVRRAVWVGIFSGAMLATKEGAVGALVPAGLAVLLLGRRNGGWRVPLWSLVAAFLALGVGSGLFVEPSRWLAHVRFISGRIEDAPTTVTLTSHFPFTLAGNAALAAAIGRRLADAMTLPGLVLALTGIVAASWRERRALLVALAVPAYVAVEFVLMRTAQLRYVLPPAFVLALFAGWAVHAAYASGRRVLRVGAGALAAAALALQLAHGASLTYEMVRDSRHAAAAWLAGRLAPGDRVDVFGTPTKLPPLAQGVVSELATEFHGQWYRHRADATVAAEVRSRWAASPPALVIVMPDHSSRPGLPFDASMPPELFTSLEAGGERYVPAAFFQTAPLLPFLRRPELDYPSVNPPIRIYAPASGPVP